MKIERERERKKEKERERESYSYLSAHSGPKEFQVSIFFLQ